MEKTSISAGQKIRIMRQSRGWTQDELAKRAGLSGKQQIGNLESGNVQDPRLSTLERVADGFGVSVSELLASKQP